MTVIVLSFMFVGNAAAQSKKDLLLMIENQNIRKADECHLEAIFVGNN